MNFFQSINLYNYRNFNNFDLSLNDQCNVLIGLNGSGKTNILEAISLFEKGTGFRKDNISNLINNFSKENYFKINSKFSNNKNKINLMISNEYIGDKLKKKLTINDDETLETKKYFENLFSIICFLPEMERLFLSSPSSRRNFLDKLIYGVDRNYLFTLNSYKKKINERNRILKSDSFDNNWIDQIEKEIVELGLKIYSERYKHINNLNIFLGSKNKESNEYNINLKVIDKLFDNDTINIQDVKNIFLKCMKESRKIDSIIGGAKFGPHKSDIEGLDMKNNLNINQFSTGQQKTVVLLIIIAQCKYLINNVKRTPILLFDEVCSHLDDENRSIILKIIESLNVQIIMTGTEKNFFSFLSTKALYFNINTK